jgi:hypothetical protein
VMYRYDIAAPKKKRDACGVPFSEAKKPSAPGGRTCQGHTHRTKEDLASLHCVGVKFNEESADSSAMDESCQLI